MSRKSCARGNGRVCGSDGDLAQGQEMVEHGRVEQGWEMAFRGMPQMRVGGQYLGLWANLKLEIAAFTSDYGPT